MSIVVSIFYPKKASKEVGENNPKPSWKHKEALFCYLEFFGHSLHLEVV